ncbi:UNVERIFIED_CONTAM: hypothetical protein FKN15_074814 [Acipenser sinensis]
MSRLMQCVSSFSKNGALQLKLILRFSVPQSLGLSVHPPFGALGASQPRCFDALASLVPSVHAPSVLAALSASVPLVPQSLGALAPPVLKRSVLQHPSTSITTCTQCRILRCTSAVFQGENEKETLAHTMTRMVLIPTALRDDLRHRLPAATAANSRAHPQRREGTRRGTPAQQRSRRQFQRRPRHPPQRAPPQPQQPLQSP